MIYAEGGTRTPMSFLTRPLKRARLPISPLRLSTEIFRQISARLAELLTCRRTFSFRFAGCRRRFSVSFRTFLRRR